MSTKFSDNDLNQESQGVELENLLDSNKVTSAKDLFDSQGLQNKTKTYGIISTVVTVVLVAISWLQFPRQEAILFTFVSIGLTSVCLWRKPSARILGMTTLSILTIFILGCFMSPVTGKPGIGQRPEVHRAPQVQCHTPKPEATSTTTSFDPRPTVPMEANRGVYQMPNIKDPYAVRAQDVCPGYLLKNIQRTKRGLTAGLHLAGPACNVYGTDILNLTLSVEYQTKDRMHVSILPADIPKGHEEHWILPDEWAARPGGINVTEESEGQVVFSKDLLFKYTNSPTFGFSIVRQERPDDVLFTTIGKKLIYENQFVELITDVPSDAHFYGLGETMTNFRLEDGLSRTFWANDQANPVDENIYGSHPVLLATRYQKVNERDNKSAYFSTSHGVYMRNAHGMEVLLRPNQTEEIVWRMIGGGIDMYFYSGGEKGTSKEVIQSYITSIGLPALQQYWTLGFQHCRWGINNVSMMEDIVDNYRKANIPLETIWLDIDYMDQYRDFTTDSDRFPLKEFGSFLDRLHGMNQKFVPIIDAAIYVPNPLNEKYDIFTDGNKSDVFIKEPVEDGGGVYIGAVWPGFTAFPDWIADNTQKWWTETMVQWAKEVAYDGVWADMNEISSFCVGSCGRNNLTQNPVHPPFSLPGEPGNPIKDVVERPEPEDSTVPEQECPYADFLDKIDYDQYWLNNTFERTKISPNVRNVNYPPYVLNSYQPGHDLAVHGLSPNATHARGVLDYDMHNLYGYMMSKATYNGLLEVHKGKRPYIISRSTFPGSGTVAGHWGGDNYSKYKYMALSIPQALSFSLFGIPVFGVDTCGFLGNTNEELCNRWMQLSAFFPFYRSHNILAANSQEAYVWESVAKASRIAMDIRYHLLPYWYTLLYQAHASGATVMRALAWEFPDEPTYAHADRQFLVGKGLMVIPVLLPGKKTVDGVFPRASKWYDWYNQTAIAVTDGRNTTIDAPLGHIPVYVRGGSILPMQKPGYTTHESRQGEWSILVALGFKEEASGELYVDDGESVKQEATLFLDMVASAGRLSVMGHGKYKVDQPLANVTVMGVARKPSAVVFKGETISKDDWNFDASTNLLRVINLQKLTTAGAWDEDWEMMWV